MMKLIIYFRNLLLFAQGDTVKSILAWIAILLLVAILVVLLAVDRQFIGYRLRVSLGLSTKHDKKELAKEDAVDSISKTVSKETVSPKESFVKDSGTACDGTQAFVYSGEDSTKEDTPVVIGVRKAIKIKETLLAEVCGECAGVRKESLLSSGGVLVADESVVSAEDFPKTTSALDNSVEDFVSSESQSLQPLDSERTEELDSVGQGSETSFVDDFRSILGDAKDVVETLNSIKTHEDFNSYSFENLSDQVGDLYSKLRVMGSMLCDDQFVVASSDTVDSEQIQETIESIASMNTVDLNEDSEKVNDYHDKSFGRAVLTDLEADLLLGTNFSGENFTNSTSESGLSTEEAIPESELPVEEAIPEPILSSNTIEDLLASEAGKAGEDDTAMKKSIAWLESMLDGNSLGLTEESASVESEPESIEESTLEDSEPVEESSPVDLEPIEKSILLEEAEPVEESTLEEPEPVEESSLVEELISEPEPIEESSPVKEPEVESELSALDLCMNRHKGFVPAMESRNFSFTYKIDGAFVLSNEDGKLYFSNTFVRVNDVPKPWIDQKIIFYKNNVLDVDTGIIAKLSESLKYSYAVNKEELLRVHGLKITDFYFDEQDSLHAEFFALENNVILFEDDLIVLNVSVK